MMTHRLAWSALFALSAAVAMADVPPAASGALLHRYDFEQNDASDAVGTAHGRLIGRPQFVDGRVGRKAVWLDGDQDRIEIADVTLGETFTIALWAKPAFDGLYNMRTLVASCGQATNDATFQFTMNTFPTIDGTLAFGSNGLETRSPAGAVPEGVWSAVAVTVDLGHAPTGTPVREQSRFGTARLFVNGVAVTADSRVLRSIVKPVSLVVGRFPEKGFPYRGAIDDLRVYAGVLPLQEIAALAAAPAGADRSGSTPIMQVPPAAAILRTLRPGHPRLFLTAERLQQLRSNLKQDATLQAWSAMLRQDADADLAADPPRYDPTNRPAVTSAERGTPARVENLAMMYHLTGERRYADRVWRELEALDAFPDWHQASWLDTAEVTAGFAVAYDWLYAFWTPEQRAILRRALLAKGLHPALDTYENRLKWGWYRVTFNWNQVCNGGVMLGALALADEEPELAGKLLRYGLLSLPRAVAQFAPDGASPEAPNYWCYANLYSTLVMAALRDALGTDFGLTKIDGVSVLGDFPVHIMGPFDLAFNYGDSPPDPVRGPQLLWLASTFDRPEWARHQQRLVRPGPCEHDYLPLNMLWYDPALMAKSAPIPALDHDFRQTEAATFRGAWQDPHASFLAARAGDNQSNHSHLSCGSFVFDALGFRWVMQQGAESYSAPGWFDTHTARWTYYRARAEGHNTLVINPGLDPDQDPLAATRITQFVSGPQDPFAIMDLTPAYARHARRVERGFALLDRQQALVQDEIQTMQPAEVWWFMHTQKEIALSEDGRTATLRKQDKAVAVRILSPPDARFVVMKAQPLPTSPVPKKQDPNEGTRKLAIHLSGVTETRIAVLLTPLAGPAAKPAPPPPVVPLAQWQAAWPH